MYESRNTVITVPKTTEGLFLTEEKGYKKFTR